MSLTALPPRRPRPAGSGRGAAGAWLAACLLVACGASAPAALARDFDPVKPADLRLQRPLVDPGADAEALELRVEVEDRAENGQLLRIVDRYVRIKVFTDKGAQSHATLTLPSLPGYEITDVEARTTRPDGTIQRPGKNATFERRVLDTRGLRIRTKSLAMPGVVPGAVLEYRYTSWLRSDELSYLWLPCQLEIPVHREVLRIRPLGGVSYSSRFNQPAPFASPPRVERGTTVIALDSLRAHREEPFMPADGRTRLWLLGLYGAVRDQEAWQKWQERGAALDEWFRGETEPTREIRAAAAEAVAGAADDEERLRRLFDLCRARVRNLTWEALTDTAAPPGRKDANRRPTQAFQRGAGTRMDIDLTFAALARAAGFETRIALVAKRGSAFFDTTLYTAGLLDSHDIAVRASSGWRLVDPGSASLPWGMLPWREEGQLALICDRKRSWFQEVPIAEPARSQIRRSADLRLLEDGTLEGEARVVATGHVGTSWRDDHLGLSAADREKDILERLRARVPDAEIAEVRLDQGPDPSAPYTYHYRLRVPGYAQRVGARLLLQPGWFERGQVALFPAPSRTHPVEFSYSWSELDSVTIALPPGWRPADSGAPKTVRIGDVGRHDIQVTWQDGRLRLVRSLSIGEGGRTAFPVTSYAPLKQAFELIRERDEQQLVLEAAGP